MLRRPDGRLLIVGTLLDQERLQLPQLLVVGLTADGALDASFGEAGVARPGIQGSCGTCEPAALAPDGSLVLTGNTGSQSPEIEHDPNAPNSFAWVVTRLTPAGRTDPAFGVRPVPGTSPGDGAGYGAAVAGDGRITVLGAQSGRAVAARLLPDGSADATFAAGALAAVPADTALELALGGDGSVTALGVRRGGAPARRRHGRRGLRRSRHRPRRGPVRAAPGHR